MPAASVQTGGFVERFVHTEGYKILPFSFLSREDIPMHLTCPRQALSRGLAIVNRVVSNHTTLPILANVLLATDHGRWN